MRASEVISTLQQRGVILKVIAGSLKIGGIEKLTAAEKATLQTHKAAILKALATVPYRLNIGGRAQLVWLAPDLEPADVLRQARDRYPDLDVTDDAPAHGWPRLADLPESKP